MKKFRKRIQKFENAEMDAEMDLKKGKEDRTRMGNEVSFFFDMKVLGGLW